MCCFKQTPISSHKCSFFFSYWHKFYVQTQGHSLIPVEGHYVAFCAICEKPKIIDQSEIFDKAKFFKEQAVNEN